jgi:hypothetical protein
MGQERGQLSIFLAISLLLVVTLLAFIVNVGLFVRAKISLQNAVDAAAFAGASVQARQLTNIAYLNWEMRNNYKEWMFKYYVLGQLGLRDLRNVDENGLTHFRMKPFFPNPNTAPGVYDPFNLPSICIHFGSEANVCEIFEIPGLPRFDAVDTGIPGIVEHHRAFLNSIVSTKAADCSVRSDLNYGTAVNWAYGTKRAISSNVPIVSSDRPGAWINSIELAIRMRNLESMVNRPPVPQPICAAGGSGCLNVMSLDTESQHIPMNERPVKAFWSAYRNLGGGPGKAEQSIARNFKLTEIPPNPFDPPENTLSTFLIPAGSVIGQTGVSPRVKHYLDLQAMPVNFVSFFTTFVTTTRESTLGPGVQAEAACGGTKTALPVPGFVLGFVKNPNVLTYYAVQGETDFVGLMFPFREQSGIRLRAYSAAKPFGGRIGPKLFNTEGTFLRARSESTQMRSAPYIAGLRVDNLGTNFRPGLPVPLASDFWVTNGSDVAGGIPGSQAGNPKYAIPNILYDFGNQAHLDAQIGTNVSLMQIINAITGNSPAAKQRAMDNSVAQPESLGLYSGAQYRRLMDMFLADDTLRAAIGSPIEAISSDMIRLAIYRSRRPTRYEALNYLIPHIRDNGDGDLELPSSVLNASPITGQFEGTTYFYELFAPLFGPGTIYGDTVSFIETTVLDYLSSMSGSITTYMNALRDVSETIKNTPLSPGADPEVYRNAADTLYRASDLADETSACADGRRPSMAGKFHFFFRSAGGEICGVPSLVGSIQTYFNNEASANPRYRSYLMTTYTTNNNLPNELLKTGFAPGPRQGSGSNAQLENPIFADTANDRALRNIYSTKFIPLEKVVTTECSTGAGTYCINYFELPNLGSSPSDIPQQPPSNLINPSSVSDFLPLRF